jgi:hypothetical protein
MSMKPVCLSVAGRDHQVPQRPSMATRRMVASLLMSMASIAMMYLSVAAVKNPTNHNGHEKGGCFPFSAGASIAMINQRPREGDLLPF